MRRVLKRIGLCACALLVLALGILAGAHLFLKTDAGAEQIIALINSLIPGTISGRDIRLSLLDQAVTMRDARLVGPDGDTIIKARRLRLTMDLPALGKGALLFRSIHLEQPVGTLMLEADGRFNIEKAFVEKRTEEKGLTVFINKLFAHAGDLDVCGPDGKTWARLKQFDLSLSAGFAEDTMMRLSIPRSRLIVLPGDRDIDCGMVSLSGALINDRIQDIMFTAQNHTSRMVVKGALNDLERKAKLEGTADFDLELAEFRHVFGIPGQSRGRISGTLKASGVYDNPDLACDLVYGGGNVGGTGMGPVTLKGAMRDRVFSCEELTYRVAAGRIRAAGTVDLQPVFPQGYGGVVKKDKVAYRLTATASGLRIKELPSLPHDFDGTLNAAISIQGQGIDPTVMDVRSTFTAGVTGFTVGRQIPRTVMTSEGRIDYRGGTLFFSPVSATMNAATLTARGRVALDAEKTIAGALELRIPQLTRFLPPFTAEARGALEGRAVLSGTLEAPRADVLFSGRECAWRKIVLGAIDLEGRLDRSGMLTVKRCRILNQDSRIDAAGSVRLLRDFSRLDTDLDMSLSATLQGVVPRDFMTDLPVSGRVSGTLTALGNRRHLAGRTTLTGEDMRYADMPLGTLDLIADLRNGVVSVHHAGLKRAGSTLAISGSARVLKEGALAWMPDPVIEARITRGYLRLEDFFPDASGQTTLTGNVHGTLGRPYGELVCAGKSLTLGPQHLDGLDMRARLEGDTLKLDHIEVAIMPGQGLKGSGSVNRQGEYALELDGQAIELAALDFLKTVDGPRGRMDLHLAGQGTLEHPRLAGHATVQGLKINDQAFPDGVLSLELRDQRLDFEGALPFAVRGWYDLAQDGYQCQAIFDHTDLTPFFGVFGQPGLSGELSGRVSGRGRGFSLRGIDILEADLERVSISRGQRPLVLADTIKGSYSHRTVNVPTTRVRFARGGGFDVSAEGSLENDVLFTARGDIPMAALRTLVQGMEGASGTIRFSAQAKANAARTVMNALITLEDLGYPIDFNGQQIHGVNGVIRVDGSQVSIDQVTGLLDTGAFTIDGRARLEGLTPSRVDFQLHATKLPIVVPDTMDVSIDGDIALTADRKRSSIEGDLALVEGTYYRDVEANILTGLITRMLRKPRPSGRSGGLAWTWPLTPETAVAVNLKRRGPIKVDNNLAQLDLNPDLKITGTLGNPIVNGRITVTQGTVTFQKNDFEVLSGAIDFVNPMRTEATVDIESQTKVRDWTITLAIEGALNNLEIRLSSVPFEEQSDILSLLLIGKTSQELTQAQTGVRVSPSGMVAELIADTYGEEIKKATSLDILRVDSGDFTTAQSGENIKLTVGKTLTPRLSIQYEVQNSTAGAVQRGIAAYKLLDHVLLNGYQGNNGVYGADIQFKYDFR